MGGHARHSDWPLALLLDEAWLRSRRVLVQGLEEAGLWMSHRDYEEFAAEQRALGERLKREILQPLLGNDYFYLGSERLFAASNRDFRSKLPLALAFGYELGLGSCEIRGLRDSAGVAEMCAVFNFGISVFDLMHDQFPELAGRFSELFDREVLRELQDRKGGSIELLDQLGVVEQAELRLLLKIIAWFFSRIHGIAESDAADELHQTLRAAYAAEVQSSDVITATPEMMTISREKSTLPFHVIDRLARIQAPHVGRELELACETLMEDIANLFWRLDDMTDIVRDFQHRQLNSLLAARNGEAAGGPGYTYQCLVDTLGGTILEETAGEIRSRAQAVHDRLGSETFPEPASRRLEQIVLGYTHGWLR